MVERPGAVLAVGDPERDLGAELAQPLAVGGLIAPASACPCRRSAAASFWIAVRIRVFAVPSGISSISPISRAV